MTVHTPYFRPRPRPRVTMYRPTRPIRVRFTAAYPHGSRADGARRVAERLNVPNTHLPKWRPRFVLVAGFLPILWMLPKCRECGQSWPCSPLTGHFRHILGWTVDLSVKYKAMSTKRRRERAARRNETAISHRALTGPRSWRKLKV